MIENVFGPFHGYYVAVNLVPMSELGDRYVADYKICPRVPKDFMTADYLLKKCVGGLSNTVKDAQEIAVQLARLQIAKLPPRQPSSGRPRTEPEVPSFPGERLYYPPTVPCPLLPAGTEGGR